MNTPTYKFKCPECDQRIEADVAISLRFVQCPSCGTDFIAPNSDSLSEMMMVKVNQFNYHFISEQLVFLSKKLFSYLSSEYQLPRASAELIIFSGWTIQMAVRLVKPNSDIRSVTQSVIEITSSYLDYYLNSYHCTSANNTFVSDSMTVVATKFYGYDQLLLSTNNVEDPLVMTLLINSVLGEIGVPATSDGRAYSSFKLRYESLLGSLKQEIRFG
jgi:hypothetical protein